MNLTELTQPPTAEYADSDYIIFRCNCTPLISLHYNLAHHITPYCRTCNTPHYRLLADGTWQSETERQQENAKAYETKL